MAANDYAFLTEWRMEAPRESIYDLLIDIPDYPRWWPEVYLGADVVTPPSGNDFVGLVADLHTKGRLPYTLKWKAEIVRATRPAEFELRATGDFDGRGIWSLSESGGATDIRFDWRLRADKPLIRALSFALKPLFSWNHRWAMERGRVHLWEQVQDR